MQQTFCDLCRRHIKPGSRVGGVMRTKDLNQIVPMLTPGQNGPGPAMRLNKAPIPEVWDLCEECSKWIWDQVEKHIKEVRNAANLLSEKKKP